MKRWRMISTWVGRIVCRERSDTGRRGVREGQSGGRRGGLVLLAEGLEDRRLFSAAFFEGMAALGGDDGDDISLVLCK